MRQADIQGKVDFVLDNLEKLARLRRYSFEEFIANFEHVDSAIYRLQTSIEALLDVSRYIIAAMGLRVPATNRGAVELLVQEGLIPQADAQQYLSMISFRNRVVHEYNQLDYARLYEILQSDSRDLAAFLEQLLESIRRHAEGEDSHSSRQLSNRQRP